MTNREFFTAIVNANLSDELTDFAKASIEKLDNRNAARSSKPSKAATANDKLAAELLDKFEAGKDYLASDIAEMMGFMTEAGALSTSKATAVAKVLVAAGSVEVRDVKVPKKGKCKAYRLVTAEQGE